MGFITWPNAISIARLPLAAAFLLAESTEARIGVVAAAAVTDFIDGKLARGTGRRSRAGELLDPIADKLFVLTVLATFVLEGRLALWELGVLLLRDLYTTAAFVVATATGLRIRFASRWSGKVVTTIQILAALALLLRPAWARPVIVAAGLAGVWAIADYTRAGLESLRRDPGGA